MSPVITTDGASNMKAAARDADFGEGFFWLRCLCHVIHCAVLVAETAIA